MAIVQPKSLIYRKAVAHVFILAFLCLIMFPLLMIVAISFRQGNFSVGDIIPKASTSTLDHWRLALGFDVVKLNKVSGATVNVINTDDGKVRFYVTSDEDPSFHNFVTEPFALADVQNLKDDNTLAVEGYADTSDAEGVTYADEGLTKEICKNVVKKLVMNLGEGTDAIKYVVDSNDKAAFDTFCNDVGISSSSAINMFIKAVLREHRIPFSINNDPFYSESNMAFLR